MVLGTQRASTMHGLLNDRGIPEKCHEAVNVVFFVEIHFTFLHTQGLES